MTKPLYTLALGEQVYATTDAARARKIYRSYKARYGCPPRAWYRHRKLNRREAEGLFGRAT